MNLLHDKTDSNDAEPPPGKPELDNQTTLITTHLTAPCWQIRE